MAPEEDEQRLDYRFTLANERTLLAWLRTSLALMAGAVAVTQLVPSLERRGWASVLGVALSVVGTVVALLSYRRWRQVDRVMATGGPLPSGRLPGVLAAVLVALGLVVAAIALLP